MPAGIESGCKLQRLGPARSRLPTNRAARL